MRAVPSRKRLFAIVLAAGPALAQARQSARQETPAVRTQPLPQPAAQQSEVRTKISVNSDLVVLPVIAKDLNSGAKILTTSVLRLQELAINSLKDGLLFLTEGNDAGDLETALSVS